MRKCSAPWAVLSLIAFLLVVFSPITGGASSQLWTHKFDKDVKWHKVTDVGTLLVSTDEGIYSFDPETGQINWQRDDLKKIPEFNVDEIENTPFLFVSEIEGKVNMKTKLHAVNILTGEDIWATEAITGMGVDAIPVPHKGFVLILTTPMAGPKSKLGLLAVDIADGKIVWESKLDENVELVESEGSGRFFKKYDLSGHQSAVIEGDHAYLPYAGLHKYDLNTGQMVWEQKYDVTEKALKRANARPIIDGDVIYTSAKGELRAIDTGSGQILWKSKKKFSGAVSEMVVSGDILYGRTGGNFQDAGKGEWKLKKPLGVVAVDKSSGELIWKYDKAKNGITNMVLLPELGTILIADEKNLIGLDAVSSEKKPKEAFKVKLEFKSNIGAGAVAGTALKVGLGGLKGLKGAGGSKDTPVAITMRESGIAVVRGKQHLLAFDPKTQEIVWSVKYQAPGVSGWSKLAMGAMTAAAYTVHTAQAASTQSYTQSNRWANESRVEVLQDYNEHAGKRFTATEATGQRVYILTKVEEGDKKGPGILGINLDTGKADHQVLLDDKKPQYKVDDVTGRVFHVKKKKELIAYSAN